MPGAGHAPQTRPALREPRRQAQQRQPQFTNPVDVIGEHPSAEADDHAEPSR
ncbi:hypothetical protein [Streptomyces sp. NPDC088196]|uniref:hypothetical protein n=1 Tax=Streptomyces sp. NPDC088196 TaxID=3154868 RepID=UPI00344F0601